MRESAARRARRLLRRARLGSRPNHPSEPVLDPAEAFIRTAFDPAPDQKTPPVSPRTSRMVRGLPKLLSRSHAARLYQLVGVTNRKECKEFFRDEALRNWVREFAPPGFRPNSEGLCAFYGDQCSRFSMLLAFVGKTLELDEAYAFFCVPSLDAAILRTLFPQPLPEFDRAAVENTLAEHEELRQELSELIGCVVPSFRPFWMIWPIVHGHLLRWPELHSHEREVVILGLLVLVTMCSSLAPVRLAQHFVPELADEFTDMQETRRKPKVIAEQSASTPTPAPTTASVEQQWYEQVETFVGLAAALRDAVPGSAALAPLLSQLQALDPLGRQIEQEREAARGLSCEKFIESLRTLAGSPETNWLLPVIADRCERWRTYPPCIDLDSRLQRERAAEQITSLLAQYADLCVSRQQILRTEAEQAHLPADLEGRRQARGRLRAAHAELDTCEAQCEALEQQVLQVIDATPVSTAELPLPRICGTTPLQTWLLDALDEVLSTLADPFHTTLIFGEPDSLEEVSRALSLLSPSYAVLTVPTSQACSLTDLRLTTQTWDTRERPVRVLHIEMPAVLDDATLHEEIVEHAHSLRSRHADCRLRLVLSFDPAATAQWMATPARLALEDRALRLSLPAPTIAEATA